jgi:uncharacterized membrane protein YccC
MRALLREVIRLDRSRLATAVAVPGAIAVVLPLAAGLATDHLSDGVSAAVGAFIVGFANLGGRYRARALTLVATTAAAGLAALVGGATGGVDALAVVMMGVWGFAGGLLVALGLRTAFLGLCSTWALLLAADHRLQDPAFGREALLITLGGILASVVALAAWPLRRLTAERTAVAGAYRALAAYARAPTRALMAGCGAALVRAAETIGDAPHVRGERTLLRRLVEEGEWIRLEVAALAHAGAGDHGPAAGEALRASADVLEGVGDSLEHPRHGRARPAVDREGLRRLAREVGDADARATAEMLVTRSADAAERRLQGVVVEAPPGHRLARALLALRAELTPRSSAFRHATRLSIALMVAVIAYRLLPVGWGYWVPLTVLFVLRPDYLSTFSRGIGRAIGTMVGVAIASLVATTLAPPDWVIVVLLTVLTFGAYAVFPANYLIFTLIVTPLVALMVEFGGGSTVGAVDDRVVDTAIGGVIALGAFALWPTREAPAVGARLADLVDAMSRWVVELLAAFGDPAAYDRAAIRAERLSARRARTAAVASVQRALAEPEGHGLDPRLMRAILDCMDQVAERGLVLASALHEGLRRPHPGAVPYAAALGAAFGAVSRSLRTGTWTPPPLPRAEALALARAEGAADGSAVRSVLVAQAAPLVGALEQLDREAGAPREVAHAASRRRLRPADPSPDLA